VRCTNIPTLGNNNLECWGRVSNTLIAADVLGDNGGTLTLLPLWPLPILVLTKGGDGDAVIRGGGTIKLDAERGGVADTLPLLLLLGDDDNDGWEWAPPLEGDTDAIVVDVIVLACDGDNGRLIILWLLPLLGGWLILALTLVLVWVLVLDDGNVNDDNDANDDNGELFRNAAIRCDDVNNGLGGAGALAGAIVAPAAIIDDADDEDEEDDDDDDDDDDDADDEGSDRKGLAASAAAAWLYCANRRLISLNRANIKSASTSSCLLLDATTTATPWPLTTAADDNDTDGDGSGEGNTVIGGPVVMLVLVLVLLVAEVSDEGMMAAIGKELGITAALPFSLLPLPLLLLLLMPSLLPAPLDGISTVFDDGIAVAAAVAVLDGAFNIRSVSGRASASRNTKYDWNASRTVVASVDGTDMDEVTSDDAIDDDDDGVTSTGCEGNDSLDDATRFICVCSITCIDASMS
jgi:hypothetical protein